MTTPERRGYAEGLHDETTIITDDDRDTQSATPALALHGRPEVGEQHPSFPGIRATRVIVKIHVAFETSTMSAESARI